MIHSRIEDKGRWMLDVTRMWKTMKWFMHCVVGIFGSKWWNKWRANNCILKSNRGIDDDFAGKSVKPEEKWLYPYYE